MAQKSLADVFNEKEFSIIFSQKGLETRLYANYETGVKTISAHGITLAYDPPRFREETEAYVTEQLDAHQKYHQLVRGELSDSYVDLNFWLDKESDIERLLGFVDEDSTRPMIELAKLVVAPTAWARLKTLRGHIKESVLDANSVVIEYGFIEGFVNYGKDLIGEGLALNGQLPGEVRNHLSEWEKLQGELSNLYSKLVRTANLKVQADLRAYKLFFPHSADLFR